MGEEDKHKNESKIPSSFADAVEFWRQREDTYATMQKHRTLSKKTREAVFDKSIGEDGKHHCWYCGCTLEYKDMQVDHFTPVADNDPNYDYRECLLNLKDKQKERDAKDNISNLVPSCALCNRYKSRDTIDDFRKSIVHTIKIVRGRKHPADWDADKIYRRYKLEHSDDTSCNIVFWYEKNGKQAETLPKEKNKHENQ